MPCFQDGTHLVSCLPDTIVHEFSKMGHSSSFMSDTAGAMLGPSSKRKGVFTMTNTRSTKIATIVSCILCLSGIILLMISLFKDNGSGLYMRLGLLLIDVTAVINVVRIVRSRKEHKA